MSPFHLSLALGPLAVYLVVLGVLNLSRKPVMTTGARDLFALGVALTGLVVVGPLDLFLPQAAIEWFRLYIPQAAAKWLGPYIWLLLLALYLFGLSFLTMMARPRLVIYNATRDEIRPRLDEIIQRLGLERQWAGDSLSLPALGVQLRIDEFMLLRNVSLVANGADQSLEGWRRLEKELAGELAKFAVSPNPIGVSLIAFGTLIFASLFVRLLQNPTAVAHSLLELLRIS